MFRRSLLTLFFVTALLAPVLPAHAYQPITLILQAEGGTGLQTDGTYVVWSTPDPESQGTAKRIYAASMVDRRPRILASGVPIRAFQEPDLDNGVAVWVEGVGAQRTIRAQNLSTGETVGVATGAVTAPAIAGTKVSWWEDIAPERAQRPDPLPSTLKIRDIATMSAPTVLAQTPNTIYIDYFGPSKMSRDWIVWSKPIGAGRGGLLLRELSVIPVAGGSPRVIGTTGYHVSSNFDLNGDRLVYYVDQGGGRDSSPGPVVVMDLRSGSRAESGPHGLLTSITTDGRYVFWSQAEQQASIWRTSLWGYDPQTDSAFAIGLGESATASNGVLASIGPGPADGPVITAARIAELIPSARRPRPEGSDRLYSPETGHLLGGSFRAFWERSGGLPVFGYPLTEEFIQKNRDTGQGHTVQYFERQRFELHPDKAGTPYEVLLGRLGVETLQRAGRDWQTFPKASPSAPHYFAETGHAIGPQFWDYWRTHGLEFGDRDVTFREALALFGMPVSEPAMETNSSGDRVLTQWFERARFENHPNNPEPFKVLLGRLAADELSGQGW